MHHRFLSLGIGVAGLLTVVTTAQAGLESWVSRTGTDAGTCPRTAPCRTFQFAHNQTNDNGVINVLDSGNYGPVTITKPISIVADGVEAVINTVGTSGHGISVLAGADHVVLLRGLTIDLGMRNVNNLNYGISFLSGAALHVHKCLVRKAQSGVRWEPSGNSELYIADSVFADNLWAGATTRAHNINATLVLDRVRTENNGFHGIELLGSASGTINATVRDSVSAGNRAAGIYASSIGISGGAARVMIARSAVVNNGAGVQADEPGAKIRIGDSTVTGNSSGLDIIRGGVIESYGNNKVNGNATDGSPTNTIARK